MAKRKISKEWKEFLGMLIAALIFWLPIIVILIVKFHVK